MATENLAYIIIRKAFLAELLKELSLEASQHIASLIKHKVIKKK